MSRHIAPQLPLPGAQVEPQAPPAPAFVLEQQPAAQAPAPDLTLDLFPPATLRRPPAGSLKDWIARQRPNIRAKLAAKLIRRPAGA